MRLAVLTLMKMPMVAFWVITPSGLIGNYRHEETYCLHLLGWRCNVETMDVDSEGRPCGSYQLFRVHMIYTFEAAPLNNLKTRLGC